jgi:hypothetical protein
MFPVKLYNLIHGNGPFIENQDYPQSIGKVWITGQVLLRSVWRRFPHPFYKADFGKRLREQQILDDSMARFVDIRINFVGDRRPGLCGETDPNVAADLTDKDRFAFKPQRAIPQAQVVSFVDTATRFLARQILMATV